MAMTVESQPRVGQFGDRLVRRTGGGQLLPPFVDEYDELRLRIDPGAAGWFRVLASTRSAEAAGRFERPFSELEIENFTLRMSRPGSRCVETSRLDEAKRFGGELFSALFRDEIRGLFRDALTAARGSGRGLRITLCLSGAPELIDVPWEFLYDAPDFLAISALTPVVRYLDLPRGPRPPVVESPLQILGVISSPADYERLDVESERANLELALSCLTESGVLELRWLEQPTLDSLLRTLQLGAFHALHYIGHGSFDRHSEHGVLLFEDSSGWGMPVSGDNLGTILHDFTSLRLAVLNACEGARTARIDPFAGVAESLVQREIPAVIAMQSEISDEAAILFAEGFYTAIAAGSPVDAALGAARLSMFAKRSDDIEWATPALFMRVADGRIFQLPDAQSGTDEASEDAGGTPAQRGNRVAAARGTRAVASATGAGSMRPTPVARSTASAAEGDEPHAAPASRGPEAPFRWRLVGVGIVVLLVCAISAMVALGSSGPTSYATEVTNLCALAASQQHALPASVRTLKTELTTASTWQQRQQYVLQEVDSRITDAGNLLADVGSLEPSTATAASWRDTAANSIKTTLTALDDYQLKLQDVRGQSQLDHRVAALDHNRDHFVANSVNTRVALTHIGGPHCLAPSSALPVVGIPPASSSANKPVGVARRQRSQDHRTKKHPRPGQTPSSNGGPVRPDGAVGAGAQSDAGRVGGWRHTTAVPAVEWSRIASVPAGASSRHTAAPAGGSSRTTVVPPDGSGPDAVPPSAIAGAKPYPGGGQTVPSTSGASSGG